MKKIFIVLVLALLASTSQAALDYDNPPPWWGDEGTTWQRWDFVNPVTSYVPYTQESGDNPADLATAVYEPGLGQSWMQEWGGMVGVLPLSGIIRLDIPNYPDLNPAKEIVIQLLWTNQTSIGRPGVFEIATQTSPIEAELLDEYVYGPTGEAPIAGIQEFWYVSRYVIHLEPNPAFETILISGSIAVDSVIVDTYCMPEPATLGLLGLGVALLRKRR